jgi:hypothetical protein
MSLSLGSSINNMQYGAVSGLMASGLLVTSSPECLLLYLKPKEQATSPHSHSSAMIHYLGRLKPKPDDLPPVVDDISRFTKASYL